MSELKFYTYLWLRKDGTPYYVGKGSGKRAYTREKQHKPPNNRDRIKLQYWLDEDTAFAYEVYFIDFWGRKDIGTGILINRSDGGENPPSQKGRKRTEESNQRNREARIGKPLSKETRLKISEAGKGRKFSAETRSKIAKAATGRKCTEAVKEKLSEMNKGKILSPETRRKMSESRKGHFVSEETKEKLRGPRGPQKHPYRRACNGTNGQF
jgi:hypothetical protein